MSGRHPGPIRESSLRRKIPGAAAALSNHRLCSPDPDLANCVRRLQHRVAPILLEDAPGILGTHAAAKICAGAGTAALSIKLTRGKLKTKEIDTLLLDPIRRWVWNGLARKHRQPPGSEKEEATYAVSLSLFITSLSKRNAQASEMLQHITYSVYCADKLIVGESLYNSNTTQPSSKPSALSPIWLTSKSHIQSIYKIPLKGWYLN